jgi:hypothetical protein
MPTIEEAVEQIRAGNRDEGRQMLETILEEDENNEDVWLWLSSVVDTDEDREICLENVLAIDPDNEVAQKGLEALRSGTFNVNDMLGGEFEEEVEQPDGETTFIDDFIVTDDSDEDGLELQDGEVGQQKKGLNVKALILAVLVILVIVVFVSLAAAAFFVLGGGGDTPPVETPAGQETPVEAPGTETEPTATPTPAPTDTPAATSTPALQLPTAVPSVEPSPTATVVVSPTPAE